MSHKRVTQFLLAILLLALMTGIVNAQEEPPISIDLTDPINAASYAYWLDPDFDDEAVFLGTATYTEMEFDGEAVEITNDQDANALGFYIASGVGFKLATPIDGHRFFCAQVKLDEVIWGSNPDVPAPDFRLTAADKNTGNTWGVSFLNTIAPATYGGCIDLFLLQGTFSSQGQVLSDLQQVTALGIDTWSIIGRSVKYSVLFAELTNTPRSEARGGLSSLVPNSPLFRCALYQKIDSADWTAPILKEYRENCSGVIAEEYLPIPEDLKKDRNWRAADNTNLCDTFALVPADAVNMFDLIALDNFRCGDASTIVPSFTEDMRNIIIIDALIPLGLRADELRAFFTVWFYNGSLALPAEALSCIDFIDSEVTGTDFVEQFNADEGLNCDSIDYLASYVEFNGAGVNVSRHGANGKHFAKEDREDFSTYWLRTAADRSDQ